MRFVVIGSPRTGSSHLVHLLGSHPDILCNGNVFHPQSVFVFRPKEALTAQAKSELLQLRETDPDALLERVFSASFGRAHVGIKIFQGQNDRILDRVIHDHDVRKIVLFRRNVLARYASVLAAKSSGDWGGKASGRIPDPPKIRFNEAKFITFHDTYIAFYRVVIKKLNDFGRRFCLVNYDEINAPLFFGGLLRFVGVGGDVSATTIKQHHVKQNPSDILSRFSNPGLARSFLRTRGHLHCRMRIRRVSHRFPSPTKHRLNPILRDRLKPTLHERDYSIGTFTRGSAGCPALRLT